MFSQPVLLALIEAGLTRDEAYRIVQRNAMRAWNEERSFRELLADDPEVTAVSSGAQLDACFDLKRSLANCESRLRRARRDRRSVNETALPHLYSGKVRELYEVGMRRVADGCERPRVGVRRRAPRRDPRQGPRPHRALAVLVRADAPTSSPIT